MREISAAVKRCIHLIAGAAPGEETGDEAPARRRSDLGRAAKTMTASNWQSLERNTLRGFFTLRLPSGLVLRRCTLHEQGTSRWVGLPGAPQIDADGRQRVDLAGKRLYTPVVEIDGSEARARFRGQALTAVDRMLAGETASAPSPAKTLADDPIDDLWPVLP
jgi:hypothetical protein